MEYDKLPTWGTCSGCGTPLPQARISGTLCSVCLQTKTISEAMASQQPQPPVPPQSFSVRSDGSSAVSYLSNKLTDILLNVLAYGIVFGIVAGFVYLIRDTFFGKVIIGIVGFLLFFAKSIMTSIISG